MSSHPCICGFFFRLTPLTCFHSYPFPRVKLFTPAHSFSNSFSLPLTAARVTSPRLTPSRTHFHPHSPPRVLFILTLSRTCFHTHSLPLVQLFIPGHSFTNLFSYSLSLMRLFTPAHSFSNLFSPSLITAFAIFTPAHFLLKLVFIPTHTPVWDFSHRFTLSLFFTPIHLRVPLFTPSFSVSNSFSSLLTYACAIFTPAHSLSNLFSFPLTLATPFSLSPRTCFHSH